MIGQESNQELEESPEESGEGADMHMKRTNQDPLVSCPIVCGEYMRATGLFFASENNTYLVTARHNVLPTKGEVLKSGEISPQFTVEAFRPTIDVYLKTSNGFDVKHLDIREVKGVKQLPEIDVIAVPFDLNPEEYGYQVWDKRQISSPLNSTEELDIIGFDGKSFPSSDHNYNREFYSVEIGRPAVLKIINELLDEDNLAKYGLMAVGVDEKFVGSKQSYNGLSGSPVLGNKLVGIHSNSWKPPSKMRKEFDVSDFRFVIYTQAEILPKIIE